MQQNINESTPEMGDRAFNEAAASGGPLPTEAPQSGKRILLSIFLYMVLLPTAIMILARLLVE
jgi:hypothetical protein